MLTGLRVRNFKVFEDTGQVDLSPLTLLAGINSAGKSSIIQALLLLKQTLESAPASALAPGRGRLLNQSLGENFNDFLFGRPDLEDATLVYVLSFAFDSEQDADLYADCRALFEDLEEPYPEGNLTATFTLTFQWGAFGHRGHPTVRVSRLDVEICLQNESLIGLVIRPAETGGRYIVEPDLDHTASFLHDLAFSTLTLDGLTHFLPDSFIVSSHPTLFEIDATPIPVSLLRWFRRCFAAVRRDLSDEIHYLNSFREPPARVYTTGQTTGTTLEPDGSNFAEVLWRLGDEPVDFVHPGIGEKHLPLDQMTAYVLREVLNLRQAVRVEEAASDILQIEVETLGSQPYTVTLADVGLGYNQILPVVVQGLLTPPGGLVIFEQPEIHLHPDVQAKLVTFLVGLARSGRRVLVETHSSHMIEYLCLEIVQDPTNWLADHAQALFVHAPDEDHPGARIEPIEITPYGEILNWPPNFLPDIAALDAQIIQAGFAKREKAQESSQ